MQKRSPEKVPPKQKLLWMLLICTKVKFTNRRVRFSSSLKLDHQLIKSSL